MFLLFFIYIYCVFCALANLKTTRPSKMQDNSGFPKIMANWAHLWFIVWFTWFSNLTRKNCFTYVSAKHKCWKTGRKHPHMTSHILLGFNTWFLHVFYMLSFFFCTKKPKKYYKKCMTTKNLIKKQHVFTCFCLQHFCVGPHYPDLPEILTKNALKINMAPKNKKREKNKSDLFLFSVVEM